MSGHGHAPEGGSKKTALLIAFIALLLSFSEHFGNHAATVATAKNIEASNLWSFFQAKTIRRTTLQTMADSYDVLALNASEATKPAITQKAEGLRKQADRMESEPETREGRRELMARALATEKERDAQMLKKKHFDLASGLLQVAIVVASTAIITGLTWMVMLTGGLGAIGFVLLLLGMKLPTLLAGIL